MLIILPFLGIFLNFQSKNRKESFIIGLFISIQTFIESQRLNTDVDGVSYTQILLTTFLIPITILSSWKSIKIRTKLFINQILQIEIFCIGVFLTQNLLIFYICYEAVLIPLFQLVGIYGGRYRKITAAYSLFIYTLIGGLIMLIFILTLYLNYGNLDFYYLKTQSQSEETQLLYWWPFFISFAIKIPMIPFHIWLPEAHVEAPTAGSVLLAGIILKLGGYGFYKYVLNLLPYASNYFQPFVWTFGLIGILYASLACLSVTDIKKAIAYSSVGHMNLAILALFSGNTLGILGSLFFMVSHGLVSSALFLLVGILYDRYGTKTIFYYRGVVLFMPQLTILFLFFSLANIAFPGTSSFIAELLCYIGIFNTNPIQGILAALGVILTPLYMLWYFHQIFFGRLSKFILVLQNDITLKEFNILLPLIFFTLFQGLNPNILINLLLL